ncbi:MAG: GFA family protein, partial [Stellaceae bacterium]
MERTASCHCGQLRAITSGEPGNVYVCHCKACQRRTGAIIHNGSRWQKSQVRIEGEHKVYGRVADSGFEIRFHFCPNCGSSVFWEGDR